MWINYANDLIIDYIQSKDEGKDVEKYKQECEAVSKMPKGKKRDMLADGLYHKLKEAPLIEGFKYYEPSSLEEIKSARPKTQIKLNSVPNEGVLYDKIYGAWLGRVSGCLLGKPIEGWRIAEINTLLKETDNYPLKRYISSDISIQIKSKLKMAEDRAWINKIKPRLGATKK